jgi:hypothetical protein
MASYLELTEQWNQISASIRSALANKPVNTEHPEIPWIMEIHHYLVSPELHHCFVTCCPGYLTLLFKDASHHGLNVIAQARTSPCFFRTG